MSNHWSGVGKRGVLRGDLEDADDALADAAEAHDWPAVLAMVRASPLLVNACRPGSLSGFAPLHRAAHAGAPVSVVRELVALGAWRTLRDARGERPVDVAIARGHGQLEPILRPVMLHDVPTDTLATIESRFHEVIRGRIGSLEQQSDLCLPQLAPVLEKGGTWWFPVPGMHGGFSYRFARHGADALLTSDSWCRVSLGSEERHEIDAGGARLLPRRPYKSGFVMVRKNTHASGRSAPD